MDLRDGLIAVGVIVLLVIVIDGIRRMRNRGRIKLDIDKQFENLPEEDLSAELPNGGARPAKASSVQGEEVDLLMDDNFKGVGSGVDDWLSSEPEETSILERKSAPVFKYQQQDNDIQSKERRFEENKPEESWSKENRSEEKSERIEPSFSADADLATDEVDLLAEPKIDSVKAESKKEQPEVSESLEEEQEQLVESKTDFSASEFAETDNRSFVDLDDGIISPVRVRKVVSEVEQPEEVTKPVLTSETAASETVTSEDIEEKPSVNLTNESDEAVSEIPAKENREEPVLSVVDEPKAEPEYDFNRPVTELMADKLPPMSAHKSSEETVNDERKAEEREDHRSEPKPLVAEDEKPLVAETRVAEPLKAEKRPTKAKAKPAKKKKRTSRLQRLKEEIQTSFFDIDPGLDPLQKQEPETADLTDDLPESVDEPKVASADTSSNEPQVLSMLVTAKDQFAGPQLFKLVEACGMEFGEMDIYHRFEDAKGEGAIQFSMVNGVKPGHFKPEQSENFSTPAVSFFLQMGEPSDLMNAFDCMLATAQCVAENLDGDVKDENHSVIRSQTIEHYRQQVRDFERRRLARRA